MTMAVARYAILPCSQAYALLFVSKIVVEYNKLCQFIVVEGF